MYYFTVDVGWYAERILEELRIDANVNTRLIGFVKDSEVTYLSCVKLSSPHFFENKNYPLLYIQSSEADVFNIVKYVQKMNFCGVGDYAEVRGYQCNSSDCVSIYLKLDTESG